MLARRKLRRRIDDALATVSPLALAEAMEAHVCSREYDDLRGMIERCAKRMDSGDRAQLDLYVNLTQPDDLLGHRFCAFLRQNPRAIASLDPESIDAILVELGEVPHVERTVRRLSSSAAAMVGLVLAVAILPLAAQYAHQRGLLQGLSDPIMPPPIVPFVEQVRPRPVLAATPAHRARRIAHHAARHRAIARRRYSTPLHRALAMHPPLRHALPPAWKFDPSNNPYFNRARWHHPYVADSTLFGQRARVSVQSYLHAIVRGNLSAALVHLGLPPNGNTNALAELPIMRRSSMFAIVGSKPQADGREQVQASIVTGKREYFAIFSVERDGPATRIVDHYFIPVNKSAQVAQRVTGTE